MLIKIKGASQFDLAFKLAKTSLGLKKIPQILEKPLMDFCSERAVPIASVILVLLPCVN